MAYRTLRFIPEAKPLLESGEISLSHLALISAKITRANRKVVLENIKGKSLREAKLFMSRVTPDGELLPQEEVCELKLTLNKSQFALLERVREVLAAAGAVPTDAEIFMKAVGDLLSKRDPMRKAERAAAKHGPKGSDVGSRTNTVENTVDNNDTAVTPAKEAPLSLRRGSNKRPQVDIYPLPRGIRYLQEFPSALGARERPTNPASTTIVIM